MSATIEVLHDHRDTREFLEFFLNLDGYRVLSTGTVEEALSLAEKEHVDLFLIDFFLSDGTSVEFTRKIRVALECGLKQAVYLLPAFWCHVVYSGHCLEATHYLKSLISTTSLALLPRETASLPSRAQAKS